MRTPPDTPETATEPLVIDGTEHERGDEACGSCWSDPIRCECGGLIHTAFGDENYDCDYWLYYRCDNCDSTTAP